MRASPKMNERAFEILFYLSGDSSLSHREVGSLVGLTHGNVYLYVSMLRNQGYLSGTQLTSTGEKFVESYLTFRSLQRA